MLPYSDIKNHCEKSSILSRAVIDDFLIHYAAEKERLVPEMDAHLRKYKKVLREIQMQYINFLKSEYIAHRIFRKDGYISKYLQRPEIKSVSPEHYAYMEFQSQHPWRFSFAEIKRKPENSFFEMEDVITGEQYLLYSPGMQTTEEEPSQRLWFNLIAYNGQCWQTFGLIIPFIGFSPDDLFFFATEINPRIEDGEMLMQEVENNPFPFFMLLSAANIPRLNSRGFESVICQSTNDLEELSTKDLAADFTTEKTKNVHRITSKKLGEFPHFAVAYYDERKKELLSTALTLNGFEWLTKTLVKAGINLNTEADIILSPAMLSIAKTILDKDIVLNPYERMFSKKMDEPESDHLKKLNHFLDLAMPFYNNQEEPDIKRLADEAGIDEKTALSVWRDVKTNMDNARKNLGK